MSVSRNALWVFVAALAAQGQNVCRLYLANQSDSVSGVFLSLQANADSSGNCQLSSVNLRVTVGDGSALHRVDVPFAWQTGLVYTASVVITAAGPQQIMINGQSVKTLAASFTPTMAPMVGQNVADSGSATENYLVRQTSLQVSNGSNNLKIAP